MLMPSSDKAVLDLARPGADKILARRRSAVGRLWSQNHAGRRSGKQHRIAAIQRQFGNRAGADVLGNGGVVGLDGRGDRLHRHGLRHCADRQGEVGSDGLVDVDLDSGLGDLLKARLLDRDAIHANTSELEGVVALFVCGRGARVGRAGLDRGHLGVLDRFAGWIDDVADQRRCRRELGAGDCGIKCE